MNATTAKEAPMAKGKLLGFVFFLSVCLAANGGYGLDTVMLGVVGLALSLVFIVVPLAFVAILGKSVYGSFKQVYGDNE